MASVRRWAASAAASAAAASWAGPAAAAQSTGLTLGDMVAGIAADIWAPFWILTMGLSLLVGLYLVAMGIFKLRDIGGHGQSTALDGLLRICGGAFLVALPDTLNIGLMSFYGAVTGHPMTSANAAVGAVDDCISGANAGLTCVAKNVATNLVPVFVEVSFGLMFLVGALMVFQALHGLATSHATGHHRMPDGWSSNLIWGILLCNTPHLLTLIATTLGITSATVGDSGGLNNAGGMLAYTAPANATVLASYASLIGYLFQIFVMFGVLAVWKGIVYLRAYASGQERGGMGPGMTHILGGVLLANAKFATCIVVNTFFGNGFGFC